MDHSTFHAFISFLLFVVIPLSILGLLANLLGTDSRDLRHDATTPTPWKW